MNRIIFSLALCVIAIAFSSCKKENEPTKPEEPTEQAYDYSKAENWMCCPKDSTHEVDVFYVYPTAVMQGSDTCVALSESEKAFAMTGVVEGPAAFSDFANIYAPYYRQIPLNIAGTLPGCEDLLACIRRNIGKIDIFAALDYFFEHYNNGRPFILVGHSQGSAMTRIILDEYMPQHPEHYSRMIAAYAIGFAIPRSWLAQNPHIKAATGESDTGVIIGWNTEGPGATMPSVLLSGDDYLINPLNWKTTADYAGTDQNLGSLVWNEDRTSCDTVIPGIADAQIDEQRHVLICTTSTSYVPYEFMGDKSLHVQDWTFYFMNIRANGLKRATAFLGHEPK